MESKMFKALFEDEDKIKIFDKLSEMYFKANFGTAAKQEIDLLMFSEYLDKLINKGFDYSDYAISKELGILQTNVRQLKKKKQLVYPRNYRWEDAFLKYAENAYFDKSNYVVINIPDPNVQIEIQHFIETKNGFVDYCLNSKLLKIPVGYYVELLLDIEYGNNSCQNKKKLIAELNKQYLNESNITEKITAENFGASIKKDSIEAIASIIEAVCPNSAIIVKPLKALLLRRI